MMERFRRLKNDQRGFSAVFVGLSFMAFMAASTLAIDVGMLMTARSQSQNAADAGALAGATALVFNDFDDHSPAGPAVSGAISAATANTVIGAAPSVTPDDVTFPMNPDTGQFDIVEVTVYRTTARTNPVATLIGRFFGTSVADVSAVARASAYPANEVSCVLPFTIPDKWIEKQCGSGTCEFDPSNTFNIYETQGSHDNMGDPLLNPDIYVPPGGSSPTGYNADKDRGMQIVLKPGAQNNVTPSMYNAWDVNGVTGADNYREHIDNCSPAFLKKGEDMPPETGNMVGPTKQGTQGLIDKDPTAVWDETCNKGRGCVKNSAFTNSPRIRAIPLYDPVSYAEDQHSGKSWPKLKVVNFLGFFIESVDGGGNVTGRVVPLLGKYSPSTESATGGFAKAIMLVK
jgi:Flp pilus assembly protein TadG